MRLQLPFWVKLVKSSNMISGKEYTRTIQSSSPVDFRTLPVESTQTILSLRVCVVLLSFYVFGTPQHRKREAAEARLK